MPTRRNILKSFGLWLIGIDSADVAITGTEPEESPSEKARCNLYWVDEDNVIWGLTRKGHVIEVHQHRSKISNLAVRRLS